MGKIGRNEKCPCQSGRKYKHCCGLKERAATPQVSPEAALKITLMSGVGAIQEAAREKRAVNRELGVFFLYATATGDAWLLEMTDCDCVQVARAGEILESPIDENPEIIEVNWSHTFAIRDKRLEITAYADRSVQVLADAPSREISAAIRRIRRRFSDSQLRAIHLPNKGGSSVA